MIAILVEWMPQTFRDETATAESLMCPSSCRVPKPIIRAPIRDFSQGNVVVNACEICDNCRQFGFRALS